MEAGFGIGGIVVLAILWFVLKPLFVGIFRGLVGLFTGNGKVDAPENKEDSKQ